MNNQKKSKNKITKKNMHDLNDTNEHEDKHSSMKIKKMK